MTSYNLTSNGEVHEKGLAMRTCLTFVAALILLAVFQSGSLLSLSYDLPQGLWSEKWVGLAEQWHELMQLIGTAEISQEISDWLETAHEKTIAN